MVARRRLALLIGLGVGAFLAISWFSGVGRSIQVRLDTGAVRFRFLGLTYWRIGQPEYVIARLRLATELPPPIKARWVSFIPWTDLGDAERHGDYWFCHELYGQVSAWCELSPRFGRFVLDDIVKWVSTGRWGKGMPGCSLVTGLVNPDSSGRFNLAPDWRESPFLEWYLEGKGQAARDLLPAKDSEGDST